MTLSQETISQAMHWLVNGKTGMSSTCMLATIINGGPVVGTTYHPCDPADFKRCVDLLNAVPEFRNRLHVMKSVSKKWASLVDHWNEIEKQLLDEIENPERRGMAPKTYDLMKCVLNGVADQEQSLVNGKISNNPILSKALTQHRNTDHGEEFDLFDLSITTGSANAQ